MARNVVRHGIEPGDGHLMTYEYDRNRAFKVFKGTQCAYVQWKIGHDYRAGVTGRRMQAQFEAVAEAVKLYEKEYGLVPWESCQLLITHSTAKVAVELRVEPS
jgi:hypothetical protein